MKELARMREKGVHHIELGKSRSVKFSGFKIYTLLSAKKAAQKRIRKKATMIFFNNNNFLIAFLCVCVKEERAFVIYIYDFFFKF